jgi:hypothetical protein
MRNLVYSGADIDSAMSRDAGFEFEFEFSSLGTGTQFACFKFHALHLSNFQGACPKKPHNLNM